MGVQLCHGGVSSRGDRTPSATGCLGPMRPNLKARTALPVVGAVGTGLFEASCQWSHQLGTGPAGRTARARGPCPNLKARECPESGLAESRLGLPGVGPEHRLDSPAGRARLSGGP